MPCSQTVIGSYLVKNCFLKNLIKLSGLNYYLMTPSQTGFTLLSAFELIPCKGGKKSLIASLQMRQQRNLMILAALAVLVVFSNVPKTTKLYDVQL